MANDETMLVETKIILEESSIQLIDHYQDYGFSSRDAMVARAFELLKQNAEENRQLTVSGDLYAELYDQDDEAKGWVEAATKDWE